MEEIIQKLHQGLKQNGWDSYKLLKNELLTYNPKDLIISLLNTKELWNTDLRSLFIIIPEIWKDFNLNDWKYIIQSVNRPSNYRILIDHGPFFEDIRFLYNWIGIDSISLYKNDPGISLENKKNLDKVFPAFLLDPMRDGELYKEDFQDGTFGDIKYFKDMKIRLINEGAKASPMPDL
ncbi:hypothetical protein [Chryseobacterium gossypii]|uniref:hypothetical protein n=1 Tax=Chryseobacterium gossypii TaxID=3231602 RepID=UPI00352341BA